MKCTTQIPSVLWQKKKWWHHFFHFRITGIAIFFVSIWMFNGDEKCKMLYFFWHFKCIRSKRCEMRTAMCIHSSLQSVKKRKMFFILFLLNLSSSSKIKSMKWNISHYISDWTANGILFNGIIFVIRPRQSSNDNLFIFSIHSLCMDWRCLFVLSRFFFLLENFPLKKKRLGVQ